MAVTASALIALSLSCSEQPGAPPVLVPVVDLIVESYSHNAVSLRFTEPGDDLMHVVRFGPATGFTFSGGLAVAEGTCGFRMDGGFAGGKRRCTVEALEPETEFAFQVQTRLEGGEAGGALSNTARVTTEREPGRVLLTPSNGLLYRPGQTLPLDASIAWPNGDTLTADSVTWRSRTPTVVRVDSIGVVTALSYGTGEVEASTRCCGQGAAAVQIPMGSTSLSSDSLRFFGVGGRETLAAEFYDAGGTQWSFMDPQWRSDDTTIVGVSAGGVVTAKGIGTARVGASAECCSEALASVHVTPLGSLQISPRRLDLLTGQNGQFEVDVVDHAGDPLPHQAVAWSSNNPTVAKSLGQGRVRGLRAGAAMIAAAAACCTGDQAMVDVQGPPVADGWENEPAGFVTLFDQSWDSIEGEAIGLLQAYPGAITVSTDNSDPRSPPNVMQHFYPNGLQDGFQPGIVAFFLLGGQPEVFFATYVKPSANWEQHPLGSKLFHFFAEENSGFYVGWVGRNFAHSQVRPSLHGLVENDPPTEPGAPDMVNDVWTKVELHVSLPNQRLRLWVNGQLTHDMTNEDSMGVGSFTEIQHSGTWGGGGHDVRRDQWLWYAHSYVSVPPS